jgi:hypothetical protein
MKDKAYEAYEKGGLLELDAWMARYEDDYSEEELEDLYNAITEKVEDPVKNTWIYDLGGEKWYKDFFGNN